MRHTQKKKKGKKSRQKTKLPVEPDSCITQMLKVLEENVDSAQEQM